MRIFLGMNTACISVLLFAVFLLQMLITKTVFDYLRMALKLNIKLGIHYEINFNRQQQKENS